MNTPPRRIADIDADLDDYRHRADRHRYLVHNSQRMLQLIGQRIDRLREERAAAIHRLSETGQTE